MKKIILLFTGIALFTIDNSFAQLPPYVPASGLVGWWSFNGNANDESGNGNNGAVNGTTLTSDRFGNANNAYSFYSTNDYIEVNTTGGAFDSQTYTISFWYITNQPPSTDPPPPIISRLNTSGSVYDNFCIFESGARAHLNYPGSGPPYGCTTKTNINDNNWHNVVFSVNTDSIRGYVDGHLDTTQQFLGGIIFQNYPIRFGNSTHSYWTEFSGDLDDIGIWNRALTTSEIFTLYSWGLCSDTLIYDTTNYFVADAGFQSISPKTYLESIDSLTTATGGCDSIIKHYSQYTFSANYCTDTTFITVYDSISVTDTLIIDVTLTGIPFPDNTNTIKIYPNPAKTFVIINTGNYGIMSDYTIKIENSLGQIVYQTLTNQQQFQIDVNDFGGYGTYFIKIIDNTSTVTETRKLVLQ